MKKAKSLKRIFAVLLAFCIVFTGMGAEAWNVAAVYADNETDEPIEISTGAEFLGMSASGNYKLVNDIEVKAPYSSQFKGNFDGQGYTVNLNITSGSNTGLFASTGNGANISNVVVNANINIDPPKYSSISYTGGLIGTVGGATTITRCSVEGAITNAYNFSSAVYVGGLVGYHKTGALTLTECSSQATVTGNSNTSGSSAAGGLAGYSGAKTLTVNNCYSTGDVTGNNYAGGLVGFANFTPSSNNTPVFSNCYSAGTVTGKTSSDTNYSYGWAYTKWFAEKDFSNCYYYKPADSDNKGFPKDETETAGKDVEGLKALAGLAEGETAETLGAAYIPAVDGMNKGYPILKWQYIHDNAVKNVTINVEPADSILKWDGEERGISENGKYTIADVAKGEHTYEVTNEAGDYEPKSGTVKVNGDFNLSRKVKLVRRVYDLKFAVTPELDDRKYISLYDGEEKKGLPDTEGNIYSWSVVKGTYKYKITAPFGYDDTEGEVTVPSELEDETKPIDIDLVEKQKVKTTFNYVFPDDDKNKKVKNGNISVERIKKQNEDEVDEDKVKYTPAGSMDGYRDSENNLVYNLYAGYIYEYTFTSGNYGVLTGRLDYTGITKETENPVDLKLTTKSVWGGSKDISAPDVDENGVYHITSGSELAWVAQQVNSGNNFAKKTIKLDEDIDLGGNSETDTNSWISIGNNKNSFNGTFDGNGKIIKNLYIYITGTATEADGYRGLFGKTDGANIKNVTLETVNIKSETEGRYSYNYVGGLVGYAKDTNISNATVNGDIKIHGKSMYTGGIAGRFSGEIKDCINNINIEAGTYVGGIAGQTYDTNASKFIRCINTGNLTASHDGTTTSYAVGGIVGRLYKTNDEVRNCVNTGEITGTTVNFGGIAGDIGYYAGQKVINCYNMGKVESTNNSSYVGGIAGCAKTENSTIKYCYNAGKLVSKGKAIGGVIGRVSSGTLNDGVKSCYYLSNDNDNYNGAYTDKTNGNVGDSQDKLMPFTKGDNGCEIPGQETYPLLVKLGSGYGDDIETETGYKYNDGYPILRWQNPASLYDVKFDIEPTDTSNLKISEKDIIGTVTITNKKDSTDVKVANIIIDEYDGDNIYTADTQLANGEYEYKVNADGYEEATGTLTIDRESPDTEEVTVIAVKYDCVIRVKKVSFAGTPLIEGYVSGADDANKKLLEKNAPDIKLYKGNEEIDDNPVVNVELNTIEAGDDTPEKSEWIYTYTYQLYNGKYDYEITKAGYEDTKGEVTVAYGDAASDITEFKAKNGSTVKFEITAEQGSFADGDPIVTIKNKGGSYDDTLVGEYSAAEYSNGIPLAEGNYTYSIKADGFETVEGEFKITAGGSETIKKTLKVKTGWGGSVDTDWYTNHPNASVYTIKNEAELAGLAQLVNVGVENDKGVKEPVTFEGKTIKLARDMNLRDSVWTPIGGYSSTYTSTGLVAVEKPFSGTFDGQGCSITLNGQFTNNEMCFGLFGYTKFATIENVVLMGTTEINYSDSIFSMQTHVGALVGYAYGTKIKRSSNQMILGVSIENIGGAATANVGGLVGWSVNTSYSECNNIAAITGGVVGNGVVTCYAGGIAGYNNSSTTDKKLNLPYEVLNCYNTGNITASAKTTAANKGEIGYAGGLIGNLNYSGSVNEQDPKLYFTMEKCYNTGTVEAEGKTKKIGMLVGFSNGSDKTGKLTNNYYLVDEDSDENPSGKTADYMKSEDFVNDLGNAYKKNTNGGYPLLEWEDFVAGIEIKNLPNKTVYNDLEDFDDTGMTIAITGEGGSEIVSGWTILDGKSLKAGQQFVTVEYKGATVTQPITVKQVVHIIDASELAFDIKAPIAGETPQSLLESGSDKFNAAISWTKGREAFTDKFEEGAYYRANVTLTSVYEEGNVYWAFDKESEPAVDSAYELKNIRFTDNVEGENNANNVMTFTVTFRATSSASGLTDKVSHLYYEGDDSSFVKFGDYLTNKLVIEGGVNKTYTVRELEQLALDSTIGMEGEFGEYNLAGIKLYDLLLENGLSQNTADDTVVYIYGKDRKPVETTIGELRSATGKDAVVIAYGDVANGMPLGSAHGPLWIVQNDIAGIWCSNVTKIEIGEIKEADECNVTFTTDPEGGNILVKDAYGNVITALKDNVYSLRKGEAYSYTASKDGYSTESGTVTVTGEETISIKLRTVWDGNTAAEGPKVVVDEDGTRFYAIYTAEELMWWHENYEADDNVRLMADITLNDNNEYKNKWEVLGVNSGYGTGTLAYTGTFDGNGHVIRGLYISRENTLEYWLFWDGSVGMIADRISEIGMFGYTGNGAVIKDLGVEGMIEVFDRPDSMYADWLQIGGIVGFAQGDTKIENCYTNIGIKAVASTETGMTGGYPHSGWGSACDLYAGGIAGSLSAEATIENCYSKGTIIGAETRQVTIGGIVGGLRKHTTSVKNCYSEVEIQAYPLENTGKNSYEGGIVGNAVAHGEGGTVEGSVALNKNIKGNNEKYITAARVVGNADQSKLKNNRGLSSMMTTGVKVDSTDILNGKLIMQNEAEKAATYESCGWSKDIWNLKDDTYPSFNWQTQPAGEAIEVGYKGQEYEENTDWDGIYGKAAPPPYFNIYFKVGDSDSILAESFTKEQMLQMAADDNEGILYYSASGYFGRTAGRAVKEYVYLDTIFKNADVTFEKGDKLEYGTYYQYDYDYLMADRYYYPEWNSGSEENAEKIKPVIALKSYGSSSGVSKGLWNMYAQQADYLYAYMLTYGQENPDDETYPYFTYQQVEGTVVYKNDAAANTTVKNWLSSIISQAQADCDATFVSTDGTAVEGGYKYVEDKAGYETAIKAAREAMDADGATNGDLMTAGKNLEAAMKEFDKLKKDGLGKNKTKLESAIELAKSILNDTATSEDGSGLNEGTLWATAEEKAALDKAIKAAQQVLRNPEASQAELDEAAFTLTSALADFATDKGKIEDTARAEAEAMLRDYVDSYIDKNKYRLEERIEIDRILKEGIKNIDNAKTVNTIKFALDDTLEKLKAVKTALEAEKADAKAALSDYFYSIVGNYDASQQVVLREVLTQNCEKIDKAVTVEEVKGLIASGKAAMDKVEKKASQGGGALTPGQQPAQQPTEAEKALETAQKNALDTLQSWYEKSSQYYEQQQAELAAAVLEGVKAIRSAKDVSAVTKALDSAVDKIKLIKTKEQIDSENAKAEELIKQAKAEAAKKAKELKVTTKSTKTAKGNIKVIAKADISELEAAGFTVKYKFYRSTKKTSGYKLKKTTAKNTYINTSAKKGKKYYYKTKLAVYYNEELIAQTTLKQSTRAARRK